MKFGLSDGLNMKAGLLVEQSTKEIVVGPNGTEARLGLGAL